jgi:transposase
LPTHNRLTVAFKMAASTLWESRTYLGRAVPTIADMAAKLARQVYRMLRFGMQYVDQGAEFYDAQHRQREIL